jgi:signal peptidase I
MNTIKYLKNINKLGYTKYYYLLITFFVLNCLASIIASNQLFENLKYFTNSSDSMLPVINSGSLSIVRPQPMNSYEEGDIITYYQKDREGEVTHRIYRHGGNVYITKGDNNEAIDSEPVLPRLVIGRVITVIPLLGYWITFIKSPIGVYLFILLPTITIVVIELSNIFFVLSNRKNTRNFLKSRIN